MYYPDFFQTWPNWQPCIVHWKFAVKRWGRCAFFCLLNVFGKLRAKCSKLESNNREKLLSYHKNDEYYQNLSRFCRSGLYFFSVKWLQIAWSWKWCNWNAPFVRYPILLFCSKCCVLRHSYYNFYYPEFFSFKDIFLVVITGKKHLLKVGVTVFVSLQKDNTGAMPNQRLDFSGHTRSPILKHLSRSSAAQGSN